MLEHSPITPPPELVKQWEEDWNEAEARNIELELYIATRAAQWGADQELEACCKWLKSEGHEYEYEALLAARRPKPLSLKEQALEALSEMEDECLMVTHSATIRRALEALPDD